MANGLQLIISRLGFCEVDVDVDRRRLKNLFARLSKTH